MDHALTKLCFHSLCMLFNMCRLIQEKNSLFHIEQFQKRNRLFVEIIHISVKARCISEFHHLLFQLFDMRGNPMGFLRMEFFPELLLKCRSLLFDLFHTCL